MVVGGNGPHIFCYAFAMFARIHGFEQTISSPRYPPVNGEAKRKVQMIKVLLEKVEGT